MSANVGVEVEYLGDGLDGELLFGADLAKPGADATGWVVAHRDGQSFTLPEAPKERAAFVRHHVEQIIKSHKTSASHRSKAKMMMQRAEAAGDVLPVHESKAEYEMALHADALAEAHLMALIERTELR